MIACTAVVIIPCAEGSAASAVDTAASVDHYCPEPHEVVLVDDHSRDDTYERLLAAGRPHWHVLRNPEKRGLDGIIRTIADAYRYTLRAFDCEFVLKIDTDSLVIRPGLVAEALAYIARNPEVGAFGVYIQDYDRPRDFAGHRRRIDREVGYLRLVRGRPWWYATLRAAERYGYERGENISGGGSFIVRGCLERMSRMGMLEVPAASRSKLKEDDVYFSMAAMAAGYQLGHFAAPDGPLCIEWKDLPYPAMELWERGFKLVHSLDKGRNITREANGGMTAREVFQAIRAREASGAVEEP